LNNAILNVLTALEANGWPSNVGNTYISLPINYIFRVAHTFWESTRNIPYMCANAVTVVKSCRKLWFPKTASEST